LALYYALKSQRISEFQHPFSFLSTTENIDTFCWDEVQTHHLLFWEVQNLKINSVFSILFQKR